MRDMCGFLAAQSHYVYSPPIASSHTVQIPVEIILFLVNDLRVSSRETVVSKNSLHSVKLEVPIVCK